MSEETTATAGDTLPESLFVSDEVRQVPVKLPSGKVHQIFLRDMTQADFRVFNEGNAATTEGARELASSRLIVATVCTSKGEPAMTEEQALKLKPVARIAIVNAILAANDFTEGND